MTVHLKMTRDLLGRVHDDLARPHEFALERVGFLTARPGRLQDGGLVLIAGGYLPVADEDYLDRPGYGALMGSAAIRKALQHTYNNPVGMIHVHEHLGRGRPGFSRTDEREMRKFVPDFFNARADVPHGALVLSEDSARGYCWLSRVDGPLPISRITVVGSPMLRIGGRDE
ncbi:MAG TPA: hypothetical protein VL332_04740 [Candidatus Saccharimonadaceae bacterium]|jgi:hypothetical protein|nr:hypothetical protein [Candidatus Saccharimonadaceae bacterium]